MKCVKDNIGGNLEDIWYSDGIVNTTMKAQSMAKTKQNNNN